MARLWKGWVTFSWVNRPREDTVIGDGKGNQTIDKYPFRSPVGTLVILSTSQRGVRILVLNSTMKTSCNPRSDLGGER